VVGPRGRDGTRSPRFAALALPGTDILTRAHGVNKENMGHAGCAGCRPRTVTTSLPRKLLDRGLYRVTLPGSGRLPGTGGHTLRGELP
jgi:hypothetical protein